jgi:multidrug efflux pump subunit AcrA (membrane-fusion protein)
MKTLMKILNSICPPPNGLGRFAIRIALAVMALGGCKKKEESPPVVRPVRSIVVEKQEVGDPIVVTGLLRARDEVNLAFRVTGRLIERKVGVGDMVQAGQTVALLDPEVERNARNAAQADLAAARAAVEQSEAFERRQKELLKGRVISANEYDLALRDLKTTRARMDATAAQLKSAEEQLSYTELKSDAAGVITQKGAETGEGRAGGQDGPAGGAAKRSRCRFQYARPGHSRWFVAG